MGYWIFTAESNPNRKLAMRVGPYGSEDVIMALFMLAYAAGEYPESKRVRRWIRPMYWAADYGPRPPDYPAWIADPSQQDLDQLLRANYQQCAWVCFGRSSLGCTWERGLKLKEPTCPKLRALAEVLRRYKRFFGPGAIREWPADVVRDAAPVFRELLEQKLRVSCWAQNLEEWTSIFEAAAECGLPLQFG